MSNENLKAKLADDAKVQKAIAKFPGTNNLSEKRIYTPLDVEGTDGLE